MGPIFLNGYREGAIKRYSPGGGGNDGGKG